MSEARSSPEVSVVIPTHDRARELLKRSLSSALNQEAVEIEVVVVDDGSRDGTPEALAAVGDRRVRMIRNAASQGLARARNLGIAAAHAPWVAFLDDDDVWAPRKLRAQLDLAEASGASFVYSPALYVNERGGVETLAPAPDPRTLFAALLRGVAVPAGGSNVIVERELITRAGGFDPRFVHLVDFECWLRLVRAHPAARCDEPLLAYVQHPRAMHLGAGVRLLTEIRRLHRMYRTDYAAIGARFDGEAFLRWIAVQHRTGERPRRAAAAYLILGLRYPRPGYLARAVLLLSGERNVARMKRLGDAAGRRTPQRVDRPVGADLTHAKPPDWLAPYLP